ncbi:Na+/H+ antiporter subunit E [Terrihabitans sp. B22-R8]|uniref:Na+/H+ antiporter subunit E n=1 Tax=Terrihabitans sp. B22-R8 TaxID=3425128 RepID=UPI00403CF414
MRRVLPHPYVSLALLGIWLLLNQSVSPGQLLLGVTFGLLGPLVLQVLDVPPFRMRHPMTVIALIWAFAIDMVRSNINVARVILGREHDRTSGFVDIPLRLRSPYGLSVLACLITAAPGTSWVAYDPATGLLTIHVLDLVDDDDWASIIKNRYENRLMEIFE